MAWMKKAISLAVQAGHLGKMFPKARASVKRSQLTWIARLQPSPLSDTYTIRLQYKLGEGPDIKVLNPKIKERDGRRPPHLYPKERLCLYMPGMNEWNGDMLFAETIVPWISEWLLNYEIWLATGEWCGGGEHPEFDDKAECEEHPKQNVAGAKRGSASRAEVLERSCRPRRPRRAK